MALVTVRPDSTPLGASNFAVTGAATVDAALSDNNVATFVKKSTTGNGTVTVGFGTFTIAPGTRVTNVRLRAQVLCPTSLSRLVLTPISRVNGVDYVGSALSFSGFYTTAEYAGAYFPVAPDGYAWDQARIDGLRARIGDNATGGDLSQVFELFFDVITTTQPSITVTAPVSPVSNTSRPQVQWTYTDADSFDQDYYRVRVFPASTYTIGGFDPATSTPVWDSGVVASNDNTVTIDYYLTSGVTYRAYVTAAKTVSGEAFYSDYKYAEFLVSTGTPAVPALSASFNSANNRVWLSASGQSAATATRTNLITNPSFEVDLSGWTNNGGTQARDTSVSYLGAASMSNTNPLAANGMYFVVTNVTPGSAYTASMYVRSTALVEHRVLLRYYNASNVNVGEQNVYTMISAGWTRVSNTLAAPATASYARVYSIVNGAITGVVYTDAVLFETGSTLQPYFDGSVSDTQPRGYSVAWTGTAHASTSVLTYTGFASQVFELQRSTDGGATWADVTGAGALVPSGTFISTVFDYSAPRAATSLYRVRSIGTLSGELIGSAWSASQPVVVSNDGTWWLKAVEVPALNQGNVPVSPGFGVERVEQAGVFRPLGRGSAVVVTAGLQGEDGKLTIRTGSKSSFDALWALCCHVGTLLLQTPDGYQRFIRVTSRSFGRDGTVRSPLTKIELGYVEVSG